MEDMKNHKSFARGLGLFSFSSALAASHVNLELSNSECSDRANTLFRYDEEEVTNPSGANTAVKRPCKMTRDTRKPAYGDVGK